MVVVIIFVLLGVALPIPVWLYTATQVNKELEVDERYTAKLHWMTAVVVISLAGGAIGYQFSGTTISIFVQLRIILSFFAALAAATYDIKLRVIPNTIPLLLFFCRILIFVSEWIWGSEAFLHLIDSLIAVMLVSLVLFIATKASKGGVGAGDIKLIGAIGFMCGIYAVINTVLFSLLICTFVAVPLLVSRRKELSGSLPFAPFVLGGLFFTIILSLY